MLRGGDAGAVGMMPRSNRQDAVLQSGMVGSGGYQMTVRVIAFAVEKNKVGGYAEPDCSESIWGPWDERRVWDGRVNTVVHEVLFVVGEM
jgi:hypothetical protein